MYNCKVFLNPRIVDLPMVYFRILIMFLFIFLGYSYEESEKDRLDKLNPTGFYGDYFSEKEIFTVDQLILNPGHYLEKQVLVSGSIIKVCPLRVSWVQIKDEFTNRMMRIKVKDGEIVSPLFSEGKILVQKVIL